MEVRRRENHHIDKKRKGQFGTLKRTGVPDTNPSRGQAAAGCEQNSPGSPGRKESHPQRRQYYYAHFTKEETESQRKVTYLRSYGWSVAELGFTKLQSTGFEPTPQSSPRPYRRGITL